uniref:Uncharacterized protein n=1 Tax=Anguilla anguilla TaxID=7936 RepID=A0A0E9RUM2_ANGAN
MYRSTEKLHKTTKAREGGKLSKRQRSERPHLGSKGTLLRICKKKIIK